MTIELNPGDNAPDFDLPTDTGRVSLSALKGRTVVLYFYPKDDTPGCTKEACGFNDALPDFGKAKAEVIGISRDSVASHDKFAGKDKPRVRPASDEDGKAWEAYGTWVE